MAIMLYLAIGVGVWGLGRIVQNFRKERTQRLNSARRRVLMGPKQMCFMCHNAFYPEKGTAVMGEVIPMKICEECADLRTLMNSIKNPMNVNPNEIEDTQ